jgi:signal transduction histidine kinase
VLIGTLIIIVTSAFGSWRTTRKDFIRVFTIDVRDEEIQTIVRSRALADAAREAAEVLHGTVQTRLIACAMAIDHAANTGDVVIVNQALVQARAILEPSVPELLAPSHASVAQTVQRKAALWSGLAEVTVDVDAEAADIRGATADAVASVVEEGIANAIQHGAATSISVCIASTSGSVVITIDDDGSGPSQGVRGLGSDLLDRMSTDWSLLARPGGTRLTAVIPATGASAPVRDAEWV